MIFIYKQPTLMKKIIINHKALNPNIKTWAEPELGHLKYSAYTKSVCVNKVIELLLSK